MDIDIVVVGSLNRDISVMTHRLPLPGETVIGSGHFTGPGGKGANQAVAAATLGARVAMVGNVGDDDHGRSLISALVTAGVDVSGIGVDDEAATGLAVITIDDDAENTIVVSPGANLTLDPSHVEENSGLIAGARVVLAQLEVPVGTVTAAAELATGIFCLNPAPARPLPGELLERVDVLIPNRTELALLTAGNPPETPAEAADAVRRLAGNSATVVTLGAGGAVVVVGDEVSILPALRVEAVDPTGAGDAFCGALAYALSRGQALEQAARWATAAGAIAVTRRGAQTGMPTVADVEALLRR